MYTFVFDITANGVNAGIYKDKNKIAEIVKMMEFGQAEELVIGTERLLKENRLDFADIDLLGVCVGPGSFTGVRAGLAFARGLSLAKPDLAITGVSAFEVYARMLQPENRAFNNAVVIETKRDDFYFQLFDANLEKVTEPMAATREEIIHHLKNRQTSFIGDGVERLLSVSSNLQIKYVDISSLMSVDALFYATYQKYLDKTLDFPKPLYIRGADTCVK